MSDGRSAPSVFYVGSFRFPDGDAAAARVLGIGKALRQEGCNVFFAGGQAEGRTSDRGTNGEHLYEGFPYYSTGELRTHPMSPARRVLAYLSMGAATMRWLHAIEVPRGSTVILYGGTTGFVQKLRRFCDRRGAALIVDCTEWNDPRHLVGGRFGPVRLDKELLLRYAYPRVGNVIAISGYLQRYYEKRGCRVVRVPPLVDLDEAKWKVCRPDPNSHRLRLIYAGSPAKKDYLGNIVLGVKLLRDQGYPVALTIVGVDNARLGEMLGSQVVALRSLEADGSVQVAGRVAQHEVPALLSQADMSVLVRPNEVYANAGFPTKVVESLAAGVPVMVNATSDISHYVRDSIEGILLGGDNPGDVAQGVLRVLSIPRGQLQAMRGNALARAKECFDYRSYGSALREFISDSVAKTGGATGRSGASCKIAT